MTPSAPTTDIVRCSACGHPTDIPPPPRCTLCDAPLLEKGAEGADVSPFAERYARDEPARRVMNNWVWFAGRHRLKHLALMRASAASRTFARTNLFVLAVCMAVFAITQAGWRLESSAPRMTGEQSPARHMTWMRLVEGDATRSTAGPGAGGAARTTQLWWSPIQSGFATVHAFVAALLACLIAHWLIRTGTAVSLGRTANDGQHMIAALHYGTAWIVPLIPATVVVSLRPLAYFGEAQRWSWHPSRYGLELAAAVVAVFAAVMWWFWLIRMGSAAASRIRGRVVFFFAVGVPIIVGVTGFGWYLTVQSLNRIMFRFMGITF